MRKQNKADRVRNRTYRDLWSCWDDVGFAGVPKIEPRFVFGEYSDEGYDGCATLITSHNGRTFKVTEGSHCSCFGLSDIDYDNTIHGVRSLRKFMTATRGFWHDNRVLIEKWLKHIKPKPRVHIDIETRGTEPGDQSAMVTIIDKRGMTKREALLTPPFKIALPRIIDSLRPDKDGDDCA